MVKPRSLFSNKNKKIRILYIKDEIVIKQEAYAYFRIEITLKTWYNIFG